MKSSITFTLVLFFIVVTACNGNRPSTGASGAGQGNAAYPLRSLQALFDSAFVTSGGQSTENIKAYVVIPNTGCPGCISSAESMFKMLIVNNYPVRVVLTNVASYKMLRMKFGDSLILNPRVYVDRNNKIFEQIDVAKRGYPMVVYVDTVKHQLSRYEYFAPDNPGSVKHIFDYLGIPVE